MFHFQDIRQAAADNYGYVTMATAAALGIKPTRNRAKFMIVKHGSRRFQARNAILQGLSPIG